MKILEYIEKYMLGELNTNGCNFFNDCQNAIDLYATTDIEIYPINYSHCLLFANNSTAKKMSGNGGNKNTGENTYDLIVDGDVLARDITKEQVDLILCSIYAKGSKLKRIVGRVSMTSYLNHTLQNSGEEALALKEIVETICGSEKVAQRGED